MAEVSFISSLSASLWTNNLQPFLNDSSMLFLSLSDRQIPSNPYVSTCDNAPQQGGEYHADLGGGLLWLLCQEGRQHPGALRRPPSSPLRRPLLLVSSAHPSHLWRCLSHCHHTGLNIIYLLYRFQEYIVISLRLLLCLEPLKKSFVVVFDLDLAEQMF